MSRPYEVLIVGGGPAGATAAYVLARNGMTVTVVDKAVFPRDKLCGGLLSERSRKTFETIFERGWGPAIERTAGGMAFYYKDRFLNRLDSHRRVYFTSRAKFDASLLEMASEKGAGIIQGAGVSAVDLRQNTLLLTDGRRLRADFVIGADGVNSCVAKQIDSSGKRRQAPAFGLEIELPRGMLKRAVEVPEIYLGIIRWGYGWVFPKEKSDTIGVAGLISDNGDLKRHFEDFLRQVCGFLPDVQFRGHHIPFGTYLRTPGRCSTLLAGDAAGLVEPVTGEGIAFAMQSGKCAADAICRAASSGAPDSALDFYLPEYRRILSRLRQAKIMRYLFFPAVCERILSRVLPHSRTIIEKYMDLLADDIDYADYVSYIIGRILKNPLALWKLARRPVSSQGRINEVSTGW